MRKVPVQATQDPTRAVGLEEQPLESHLLHNETDVQWMRDLMERLPDGSTVVDFEESMLLPTVQATTRLWQQGDRLIAFAWVDDYNNLQFDVDPQYSSPRLEAEIVGWGTACLKERNAGSGEGQTLDASCRADNIARIAFLERHGFMQESIRSLHYARSLETPIPEYALPQGFSLRSVAGEEEAEALVALHRAAFGTRNMTVEQRLAIMRAPQYEPELDLVVVAPNGDLAAFCVCSLDSARQVGYTDPIGTHAHYKRLGLGKAMVTAGLHALKYRGTQTAELSTSSENLAMRRLAEAAGFTVVSESLWFSKTVT